MSPKGWGCRILGLSGLGFWVSGVDFESWYSGTVGSRQREL